MNRLPAIIFLQIISLLAIPAEAQVSDSFADGNFSHNPEWQGKTESWAVIPSGYDFALQSAGAAAADTIHLATSSRVAYGTWSFTFSYTGVNLSNFNGARVYLTADQADLDGEVRGYFVQLGTNNSDEIRLYRQDGSASSNRVELARSEQKVLEAEMQSLHITAARTTEGLWSVHVNGELILSAQDDTYASSSFFGIWVKHTSTAARAYTFDDLEVHFGDSRPPAVLFAEQVNDAEIDVYFDEALDTYSVEATRFDIGGLIPEAVHAVSDTQWRIVFRDGALPENVEWQLGIREVRDIAGNELIPAKITIAQQADSGDLVINEIMYAPLTAEQSSRPAQPEYIELYNRTATTLALGGAYRTRQPDATGDADTLRFDSPHTALPPNSFALIFAESDSTSVAGRSALAFAFPDVDFDHGHVTLLPVRRASLGLRNGGDLVRIHRQDGTVLDEVAYVPEWHNPALADLRGISLERIAADAPGQEAVNWTSSPDLSGGTPGYPNAVSHEAAFVPGKSTLTVEPSPFSPDHDGFEDATTIRFTTPLAGGSIRVRIYDSNGRLVRTLVPAALTSPEGAYEWDGLDDAGRPLRIGMYVVAVDAVFPNEGITALHKKVVVLARPLD